MTTQPTCDERITEHMESRLEDLRALVETAQGGTDASYDTLDSLGVQVDGYDDDRTSESAQEVLYEYGLSLEVKRTAVWCLSWGGPADYFEVDLDDEGGTDGVTYRFSDWYDTATAGLDYQQAAVVTDAIGGFLESMEVNR